MTTPQTSDWPHLVQERPGSEDAADRGEIAALRKLRAEGLPVARLVVMPASVEERFYRLNNLPERLLDIFSGVDPADPDEDELEELAPEAMRLLERHFLLDELIDAFYERIAGLPARVHVRRAGQEGIRATRGRPALLAVKRLWSADWSFKALVERVPRTGSFALEARDVLVHGAEEPAPAELVSRVAEMLGRRASVWTTTDGAIARLDAPQIRTPSAGRAT